MPASTLSRVDLPVPFAPDDADALLRRDQPVQVFKKDFGAEAFAGFGELNHDLVGYVAGCQSQYCHCPASTT